MSITTTTTTAITITSITSTGASKEAIGRTNRHTAVALPMEIEGRQADMVAGLLARNPAAWAAWDALVVPAA
jgi:hypothetical protein